ncbi:MAG: efflux RND transporter periplasmic adaptor subunit [Calditrichia bacterium]
MIKKVSLVLFSITVVFLVSCGSNADGNSASAPGKTKSDSTAKKDGGPSGFQQPEISAVPVEVTPVVKGAISSYLLYNATLETEQMADVFSRISGIVENIMVEEGQRVRKDQALLQIEQDEYRLQEEQANLQYEKQQSEFKRFQALKDKNLISEEEFENARLSMRQAEIQWKQARLNLDFTTVRSPISGVVGERLVRQGDRIQPSTRLFMISNLQEKVAKIYVPQGELANLSQKQTAVVTSEVLPDVEFEGWVKRISPVIDPTSGTFKVTVGVKDPDNRLRPGMFVTVRLVVDTRDQTVLLPKTALFYENERSYFFVLEGDTARRLELEKGFEDAEKVEILNAVSDSAFVVVIGQGGLKNGSLVEVVDVRFYNWQEVEPGQKEEMKEQVIHKRTVSS